MAPPTERRNSVIGGLVVLLLRGILLWVVIPIAALTWVIVGLRLRRRGVRFAQYLGWVDLNLIAVLQRTVARPLVRYPTDRVPAKSMPQVTHRLRAIDPA